MAGRKRIEISTKEIERLAGLGFTQGEICLRLGFSDETLRRRMLADVEFGEAIKRGRAAANDKVSSKLMALVNKGNLGAIIWYEKTRRGLTDRVEITTWQDKVIKGLRSGAIDPNEVEKEFGHDLAQELFAGAGLQLGQSREVSAAVETEQDDPD